MFFLLFLILIGYSLWWWMYSRHTLMNYFYKSKSPYHLEESRFDMLLYDLKKLNKLLRKLKEEKEVN